MARLPVATDAAQLSLDSATRTIIPSTRVCRVHLFRHAMVVGAEERRCRGQADVQLSDLGRVQTAAAAVRWPGPYDRVYSSDLSRCSTLGAALGGPLELTPRLREQDMGAWDGDTWAELTQRDGPGTTAYWDDYVNARPPGGESYGEVYTRVNEFFKVEAPEGVVAVVTHIGCIRALLCGWLGLGAGEALRWAPGYASHTEVLLADAGAVIVRFGETAY